ncbi:hypothetical protein BgiBS90_001954 [Biomphalaria glabrata]|nr:hypothetical protein BgiBS90_001954 [Biomphalaria glabrata]
MENVSEKVNKSIEIVSEFAMDQPLLEELKKKPIDDFAKLQETLTRNEAENRKLMEEIGSIPKEFLENSTGP